MESYHIQAYIDAICFVTSRHPSRIVQLQHIYLLVELYRMLNILLNNQFFH